MENEYNNGIWTEQEYKVFEEVLNNRFIEIKDPAKIEDYWNDIKKSRKEN